MAICAASCALSVLHLSMGTYVCTEAELAEKGQDYPSFDYYIVLEATDANMAFIQSELGTTDRAGYTY